MKKLLLGILCLLLTAALLGCNTAAPIATPDPDIDEPTPTAPAPTDDADDAGSDDPVVNDDAKLERGLIIGSTYTSEYAGLTFEAPEGWVYGTDEQISTMMGIGIDAMSQAGMQVSQEMLDLQTIYDMMVVNGQTNSNITVMYENLAVSPFGKLITPAAYLASVKVQLEAMADTLPYVVDEESSSVTLAGETYQCLKAELSGTAMTQYYYVRRVDDYMLGLIVTVNEPDTIDELLASFS